MTRRTKTVRRMDGDVATPRKTSEASGGAAGVGEERRADVPGLGEDMSLEGQQYISELQAPTKTGMAPHPNKRDAADSRAPERCDTDDNGFYVLTLRVPLCRRLAREWLEIVDSEVVDDGSEELVILGRRLVLRHLTRHLHDVSPREFPRTPHLARPDGRHPPEPQRIDAVHAVLVIIVPAVGRRARKDDDARGGSGTALAPRALHRRNLAASSPRTSPGSEILPRRRLRSDSARDAGGFPRDSSHRGDGDETSTASDRGGTRGCSPWAGRGPIPRGRAGRSRWSRPHSARGERRRPRGRDRRREAAGRRGRGRRHRRSSRWRGCRRARRRRTRGGEPGGERERGAERERVATRTEARRRGPRRARSSAPRAAAGERPARRAGGGTGDDAGARRRSVRARGSAGGARAATAALGRARGRRDREGRHPGPKRHVAPARRCATRAARISRRRAESTPAEKSRSERRFGECHHSLFLTRVCDALARPFARPPASFPPTVLRRVVALCCCLMNPLMNPAPTCG